MNLRMTRTDRGYKLVFERQTGENTSDVTIRYPKSLREAIVEIRRHFAERQRSKGRSQRFVT